MIAVIFEVWPAAGRRDDYLAIAAALRDDLTRIDGFISPEERPETFNKLLRAHFAT
jgi:heme-degrading monooxygenase HmoA